ncbi:MAG: SH3 domain-containing protein [Anaerolineae bacterium]|nr:SH3 domain-containing protein [Anaerolineae bacterium]MDW8172921.1 SH3 domain-containing protein [Anaerolineae bacterium]
MRLIRLSRWGIASLFGLGLLLSACQPQQAASVREVDALPLAQASPGPIVIVVTPTPQPTLIPTLALPSPTPTLSATPIPSATSDAAALAQACEAALQSVYQTAGEACLGKPGGFFCNAGLPPQSVEPGGNLANSFSTLGALVEASQVQAVHTAPLLSQGGGGIVYLHLDEQPALNALLLGDVRLRDVSLGAADFPPWSILSVETNFTPMPCPSQPRSAFIVQSVFGQISRLVINGVSVELNGSLVVETEQGSPDGPLTHFIAIEGLIRLTILGQIVVLYPGMQATVLYPPNTDWTTPRQLLAQPVPLVWDWIDHLPLAIFDRPVQLPQPGYAQTIGQVNMRAAPGLSAQLLYQVPPDQVVSVLGQSQSQAEWLHVRLGNGETGWMRSDLLQGVLGEVRQRYDSTPMPPQRYGALASQARVIVSQGANLRTAPDTAFGIITTLPQGTQVELLARSPYSPWVKVNAEGRVGWLALITLETRAVIASLSVDYNAPLPPRPTATPRFDFGGGHAYPDPRGGQ